MPKHLEVDTSNYIALRLDEDVQGAGPALDECEIISHLIENIHAATNYQGAANGSLPIRVVAQLIRGVWEYKDRQYAEVLAEQAKCPFCRPHWTARLA
jgi:hypothetical protein